ncbi:MAG: hypothetical protein WBD04_07745 [Candidatus Omnitrophota bacterium]
MKSLMICVGVIAGIVILGGMMYLWSACGNLRDLCVGLALMALVVFGWPTT